RRTPILRCASHSRSLGTISPAACELGLETIPTVLMMGIKEELPVPFGAQDGAFHNAGLESELLHDPCHPFAHFLVELGVAHDAALPHQSLSDLKLRFDQYNHLAVRLEQRQDGG